MHAKSFQHLSLKALCLITLVTVCFIQSTVCAAPADEINRAVAAGGAANAESASAAQFIKAFSAVLTRVNESKFPQYVTSAINLRPDLAPQITVAALRAHRPSPNGTEDCNWVAPIIRAALAAAPNAKDEIVRAAVRAEFTAKECILAAAGVTEETKTAFYRPPGVDAGNINSSALGTINPGNISGQANVQSGNQERVTICHNGNTLTLPRPAAEAHIRNHPTDRLGPCP